MFSVGASIRIIHSYIEAFVERGCQYKDPNGHRNEPNPETERAGNVKHAQDSVARRD